MRLRLRTVLLASVFATSLASPVVAQDTDLAQMQEELAKMQADMMRMSAELEALKAERAAEAAAQAAAAQELAVAAAPPAPAETGPEVTWKGAPQIKGDGGWSFKPRGRLMYDAGFTDVPDTIGRDEGFANEVRRARLGIQGDMPGGFGYKFELDFAGDEVDVTDATISYETGPFEIAIGQQNTFQSLEELSSSLHTSFIERAAFTDAFGFERRIGASVTYGSGIFLAQAGVFTDNFEDTSSDNYSFDGRLVAMPKFGDAQVHLGASIHHNTLGQDDGTIRYRQRPLVHFTSERFLNTGTFEVDSEFGLGLEAAIIAGRFHASGETFWQTVERPGALADPTFFGGSAEVGYFLTSGDTRGYKSGKFDRVKPARPFDEGGIGSIQVNLRYDHLDLNDEGIVGGVQNGYFASLIWKPTDYTLLMMNYGRLLYDDAFYATLGGRTSYGVDAFGVRAQIDF